MLARPLVSPAALPQPALGAEAPAPPLPLLDEPAMPEAPPSAPPTALPAPPPERPAALAGTPPALTSCPPTPADVPPAPGAPPFCSPDDAPASVDPPLAAIDPPAPAFPAELALSELEQAISHGRSAVMQAHARKVRQWPGCMIFFSLGSMNSRPSRAASVGVESHAAKRLYRTRITQPSGQF